MRRATLSTGVVLGTLAGVLIVGTPAQAKRKGGASAPPVDARTFVDHATQDGLAEVALGKLAADKAASDDVRQFAQRMIDDHSKANDELTSLAASKAMTAPTTIADAKHHALIERLGKLSGREFDRAYMQAMVGDHEHAISAFKSFAQHGEDAELRAWASKTLPTLQEHGRLAKTTAANVGATAARRASRARHAVAI